MLYSVHAAAYTSTTTVCPYFACLIIELMKRRKKKRPAKIEVRGYNNNPGEYAQYYQNYLESNPIGNAKC